MSDLTVRGYLTEVQRSEFENDDKKGYERTAEHLIRAHLAAGTPWLCVAVASGPSWPRCCHYQRRGRPRSGAGRAGLRAGGPVLWVEPPCSLWHSLWYPPPQGAGEHSVGGTKKNVCICVCVQGLKVDILKK